MRPDPRAEVRLKINIGPGHKLLLNEKEKVCAGPILLHEGVNNRLFSFHLKLKRKETVGHIMKRNTPVSPPTLISLEAAKLGSQVFLPSCLLFLGIKFTKNKKTMKVMDPLSRMPDSSLFL